MADVLSPFSQRLSFALARLGVSKKELERRAALSSGTVSRYTNGARGGNVGADVSTRIAKALGINHEWLIHGEGEMLAPTTVAPRDPHPNRSPVLETEAFKSAHPQVQEWLASRVLPKDMSTENWLRALNAAAVLYELKLLYSGRPPRKAKAPIKQSDT